MFLLGESRSRDCLVWKPPRPGLLAGDLSAPCESYVVVAGWEYAEDCSRAIGAEAAVRWVLPREPHAAR